MRGLVVLILISLLLAFDLELNDARWTNGLTNWLSEELYKIGTVRNPNCVVWLSWPIKLRCLLRFAGGRIRTVRTRIWPAAPTDRRQYSSAPDVNETFENFDDRADDFFGAALDLDRDDWRQTARRRGNCFPRPVPRGQEAPNRPQ